MKYLVRMLGEPGESETVHKHGRGLCGGGLGSRALLSRALS